MEKFNIILIGIDALRADHLGIYGYSRSTSPNIDAIAKKSLVFQNCFSQAPNTAPSFMSIFTSRYPSCHGIIDIATPQGDAGTRVYELDPQVITFPEILQQLGFQTAAFTRGGNVHPKMGFGRGFEYYDNGKSGQGRIPATGILYWLKEKKNNPFFLFLHTTAVHNPWEVPSDYQRIFDTGYNGKLLNILKNYDTKRTGDQSKYSFFRKQIDPLIREEIDYYKSLYDGALKYVDNFIGKLFLELDRLRLSDNTIVVLTADHGEEFFEHGQIGHNQMYNEVLHVPLIIYAPGVKPAHITQIVRGIDIAPTLLEIMNVKKQFAFQGISLLSALDKDLDLPTIAETETIGYAIQNKKYKFISPRWKDYLERIDELYDLENDPQEKNNILFEKPRIAEDMFSLFETELHHGDFATPRRKIMYLLK